MKHKRKFKFTIWYFKPSGKYAYQGEVEWEVVDCGNEHEGVWYSVAYMQEAVDRLRYWDEGPLPGISSCTWFGPVVINCEQGYPCLIPEGIKG